MQVTVETTSGLERRMRITVPSSQVESKVESRLKQTAGQVRIKGFRPGKVPLKEVRRRFGEGIRQEVGSEMVQASFAEAIREKQVMPAGMPQIKDLTLASGQDLEFTAVFEVFPEITLSDFSSISVAKPVAVVTDADIDKMIETLREQRLHYHDTDRPSVNGDKVNVDFEGFLDGEAFAGGKAEGADIVLGSGSMIDGFEANLTGCSKGEEKEFTVTFPEKYQSAELAGKEAMFKVKVNSVGEPHKPELDDEFFAEFGVAEGGLDAFRAEVKTNMQKELDSAVSSKVRTQVMDGLLKCHDIEIPMALVTQEIDRLRQEAVQQFGGRGNIDPSVLPSEMFDAQARRRVTLGLIVNAIVEQGDLKLDDAKVRTRIETMASSYEQPEEAVKYYYSNEQVLGQIQNMVLEEQVVDSVLTKAVVTEDQVSYDEAIKPPASAAGGETEQAAE